MATLHLTGSTGAKGSTGASPFERFLSLAAAQKTVVNKWLFRTLAVNIIDAHPHPLYGSSIITEHPVQKEAMIVELESRYATYLQSRPDGSIQERFYAYPIEELTMEGMIAGGNRNEAIQRFEKYLVDNVDFATLQESGQSWYWQSDTYPQLVLLREWFCK